MKKFLMAVLAASMIVSIAVGGTVAFYTDTEEAINVMTSGRVNIELVERQRSEDGTALEAFDPETGKPLSPLVGTLEEKDGFGLPKAENFVDKIISVKNTLAGSDAWVRVLVAFPAGMDADPESNAAMHMVNGAGFEGITTYEQDWTMQKAADIELNGAAYSLYVFTYQHILPGFEMTATPCVTGFYMDSRVDWNSRTGEYYITLADGSTQPVTGMDAEGRVSIPVMAQAVQAAGFETSADAFRAAGFDDEQGNVIAPVFPN